LPTHTSAVAGARRATGVRAPRRRLAGEEDASLRSTFRIQTFSRFRTSNFIRLYSFNILIVKC